MDEKAQSTDYLLILIIGIILAVVAIVILLSYFHGSNLSV